jgi:ectoine hydroxylase-related dioxygenase (phytanoyl-CoA dioxygenase family)
LLNHYRDKGWVHLKSVLLPRDVTALKYHGRAVSDINRDRIGEDAVYGVDKHWNGVCCAAMERKHLWYFYTSPFMYDIVSELLETKEPWLYNDQLVWKYPNDGFKFEPHCDSNAGNYQTAKHTINCLVFVDDVTKENGGIRMQNNDNGRWTDLYPKAGDIVCINGVTVHASEPNVSEKVRGAYACVYSAERLQKGKFYQTRFYDERKEGETNAKGWYLEKERQEKLSVNESSE